MSASGDSDWRPTASRAALEARGEPVAAFAHLERAHVLGQQSTIQHVRVHWAMFRWALRHKVAGETVGQAWRIVGAALAHPLEPRCHDVVEFIDKGWLRPTPASRPCIT